MSILSDGHILIEDYPGLGKTLMAKSFAKVLGLEFKRIQFTSDLLPADITGSYVLDRRTSEFVLRKGPLFSNLLLADEINRAHPRTQSALLEAMQERQVTIENETYQLSMPFITIATQNPIEYEGTYPLPEAQIDRFLVRIGVGYPSAEEEVEILKRRNERGKDDVELNRVSTIKDILEMQSEIESVHVEASLQRYMVEIVRRTRVHRDVDVGCSPRGSLALLKLSKARAWLSGREFVIPDDVKGVAEPALAHRIILKPENWLRGGKAATVVQQVLAEVPVPKVDQ
ncbi:MAG: MoxR family ATPase [Nitrososphaerota archaeon]|nr:MoxR family ATPase [Nitrososphaerota archaeon]